VTVAAVQTIPLHQPMRDSLILIAFAVAIVTLVAQGLLLPVVVRRLRPAGDVALDDQTELYELRKILTSAGEEAVTRAVADAEASDDPVKPGVEEEVTAQGQTWLTRLQIWAEVDLSDRENQVAQFQRLRRVQLDAERTALRDAYERGAFSSEAIDTLRGALDSDEIGLDAIDEQLGDGGRA